MRRAAARGRRCERSAPAPGSRRAKGPKAPQRAKRTAAQGADGQAAVQCKRMGDPSHVGEDALRFALGPGS